MIQHFEYQVFKITQSEFKEIPEFQCVIVKP